MRTDPPSLTVISAFVSGHWEGYKPDAIRAAKMALIKAGRHPDYPVHCDYLGHGDWEILFTIRPLRDGAGYLPNGQRYGLPTSG